MNPGTELNALVAEKLLGWGPRPYNPPNIIMKWRNPDTHDGYSDDTLPRFSTDIEAAWNVVEKLNCTLVLIYQPTFDPHEQWQATLGDKTTWAATAPHAICLAALKAVGWKGEE